VTTRSQSTIARSGLGIALLSAAAFGTSGTFASSLIGAGWSAAAAVTARITVAALLLTVPALIQLRGRWRLLRTASWRMAAYGLTGVAGCQFCYFNAIEHMPVGVALLLEYLGAVLVVGWLWLRHGQRPRRLTVAGAVTAIAGLGLVLNLTGSGAVSPAGVIWGLLAAVGLAVYFVIAAAGHAEPVPPIVMVWGGMIVGAAALGLLGLTGAVPVTATARQVGLLGHRVSWIVPVAGLSLVATAIAYVTGMSAARKLGAKLASFAGMAEVLFSILFAWLLLHQLPSAMQFAGGVFIFAGVALVRADELGGDPKVEQAPAAERVSGRESGDEPGRVRVAVR
jgi:drug/metabolite transporter (DMT)-like permease